MIALGTVFERLTVVGGPTSVMCSRRKRIYWKCQCECGQTKLVLEQNIKNGSTKSCGCFHRIAIGNRVKTHGSSKTRLYGIWENMIQRCHNPNSFSYPSYGGCGIHVCKSWRSRFSCFQSWANSHGYSDSKLIDRIKGLRGYTPSNCRWVTFAQSNRNTTRNFWITAFGETRCLTDWALDERCSVAKNTVSRRIRALGMTAEDAIQLPKQPTGRGAKPRANP